MKYLGSKHIQNCPFCKSNAHASARQTSFLGYVGWPGNKKIKYAAQVICNKCKARGPIVTNILITGPGFQLQLETLKDGAIEEWNGRIF